MTTVSPRLNILCNVQDYSILYNNAVPPLICEG